MSFTRHVGKMGDRKVAVVFREIPGEPHMCLIVYTELINAHLHDALIRCIDSDIGQSSESLADALNRSFTQEGKPLLGVLHVQGLLKKVQTSQIVMTPNSNTKIKLDELNKILNEMKQGEDAVKQLASMDNTPGAQGDTVRKMRGEPVVAASGDVLGDAALASSRLEQAAKMEREANGLLAEAKRLQAEALTLNPALAPKPAAKKKTKKVENVA